MPTNTTAAAFLKAVLATAAIMLLPAAPVAAQSGCGPSNPNSCLQEHQGVGCTHLACCTTVCGFDPVCCDVGWDVACVDTANLVCSFMCGASSAGDCRIPHAAPACSDAACCATVCQFDPGCCQFQWDILCTFAAESFCEPPPPVPCGAPSAGSCTVVHGTPACSNLACCNLVCNLDPSCCTHSWDIICVQIANTYCFGCALACPTGATNENEVCGQRTNAPCVENQTPATLSCNTTVCGLLDGAMAGGVWAGDRDAYAISAVDTDNDGSVKITLRLGAEFPAFAALVPATCPVALPTALLHVNATNCLETVASACVPPGAYWVVVTPGTFPNPGQGAPLTCESTPRYTVRVECSQQLCGQACTTSIETCFATHAEPGCSDPACCATVCALDPYCCETGWDIDCVIHASQSCGLPAPPNDECSGALHVTTGQLVEFDTLGATISSPPLPAACEEGQGTLIGPDIWFEHTSTCGGNLTFSTCGSATDLRLAVYTGTCDALTLVACNTDSVICVPQSGARVQFQATCGTTYYIRVGGDTANNLGAGQLTSVCPGPICPGPCPADFNGNGIVDGADLGALLAAWGFATHDLTGDGNVNGADLGALLAAWGPCS